MGKCRRQSRLGLRGGTSNPESVIFENMKKCYVGQQQNITVASFESSSVKLDLKSQTWANPEIIHFNWRQRPLKIKFELYAFYLLVKHCKWTLRVFSSNRYKASWKSWMVEVKIFFVSRLNLRLDAMIINFHFDCLRVHCYESTLSAGIDVQLKLFLNWALLMSGRCFKRVWKVALFLGKYSRWLCWGQNWHATKMVQPQRQEFDSSSCFRCFKTRTI